MTWALYEDEVLEVLQDLFWTMFSLRVSSIGDPDKAGRSEERRLIAGIGITGSWQGTLVFECGPDTACRLAGAMLSARPYSRLCEDVRDAVGEIANIVAGNLKWMLPGSNTLSLPCILEGVDVSLDVPGAAPIVSLALESTAGRMRITVFQARDL